MSSCSCVTFKEFSLLSTETGRRQSTAPVDVMSCFSARTECILSAFNTLSLNRSSLCGLSFKICFSKHLLLPPCPPLCPAAVLWCSGSHIYGVSEGQWGLLPGSARCLCRRVNSQTRHRSEALEPQEGPRQVGRTGTPPRTSDNSAWMG